MLTAPGESGGIGFRTGVQLPSPPPPKDSYYDTMAILLFYHKLGIVFNDDAKKATAEYFR